MGCASSNPPVAPVQIQVSTTEGIDTTTVVPAQVSAPATKSDRDELRPDDSTLQPSEECELVEESKVKGPFDDTTVDAAVKDLTDRNNAFSKRACAFDYVPGDPASKSQMKALKEEAGALLFEVEMVPRSKRNKAFDDSVAMVTMPYCGWVMGLYDFDCDSPPSLMFKMAREDPMFAKLTKTNPNKEFLEKKKQNCDDEARRERAQLAPRDLNTEADIARSREIIDKIGIPFDAAVSKIWKKRPQPPSVKCYLNGPDIVDALAAELGPKRQIFLDPDFSPDDHHKDLDKYTCGGNKMSDWGRPVSGHQVFKDGIYPDDIVQGSLGDCWLIASIANVATWPQIMRTCIYPPLGLGEEVYVRGFGRKGMPSHFVGCYAIRFWTGFEWVWVLVDTVLPRLFSDRCLFASGTDAKEIWPMLLEKAWAKLHGGYTGLIPGEGKTLGYAGCMEAMVGGKCGWYKLDGKSGPVRTQKLLENFLVYHQWKGQRIMIASCNAPKPNDVGLVGNHAYSCLGCHTVGDTVLIVLRNPWGRKTWIGKWSNCDYATWLENDRYKDEPRLKGIDWNLVKSNPKIDPINDGEFYMALEDFRKYFTWLYICTIPCEREYEPKI